MKILDLLLQLGDLLRVLLVFYFDILHSLQFHLQMLLLLFEGGVLLEITNQLLGVTAHLLLVFMNISLFPFKYLFESSPFRL